MTSAYRNVYCFVVKEGVEGPPWTLDLTVSTKQPIRLDECLNASRQN